MIGRTRVRFKYLFYGMLIGVLLAPRSGKETRSKWLGKLGGAVDTMLGLL